MLRPAGGAASDTLSKGNTLAARILASQRNVGKMYPNKLTALLRMGLPKDGIDTIERSALQKYPQKLLRPLVEAYSKADLRAEAMRVLRDQQPQAVSPYEPLLVECVKAGDDQGLRETAWLMREHGAVPTPETYGLLIDARLESGEPDRALRIAQHALVARTAPPPEAIDALIVALTKAGKTSSALSVASTLRIEYGIRLEPSDLGVQTLLSSAAQSPMPLEVLSVRQELMQHCEVIGARETTGHRLLHDELIHRCVEAENLPAAMALVRQLDTEGVEVGAVQLDGLVGVLLDCDELDDATRLARRRWSHPLLTGRGYALDEGPSSTAEPAAFGADASRGERLAAAAAAGGDQSGLAGGSSMADMSSAASSASLSLDLRGLPTGVARLCCVRYFHQIANSTPTETLLDAGYDASGGRPAWRGVTILLSDHSHAEAIAAQAVSLQPPIELRLRAHARVRGGRGGQRETDSRRQRRRRSGAVAASAAEMSDVPTVEHDRLELCANREELARWARRCAEERLQKHNRSNFLMIAAGHNVLWTVALVAWMGWTMRAPL